MSAPTKTYQLQIDGLAQAVGTARASKTHKSLVTNLSALPELAGIQLVCVGNEGSYLSRRKVLAADDTVVHDDHRAWLAAQVELDGGDFAATRKRLRPLGYQLSQCDLTQIYLVQDHGKEQWAFLQIQCRLRTERRNRSVFTDYSYTRDHELKTLDDLVDDAESGYEYPVAERRSICPDAYELVEAFDFEAFLHELEGVEERGRNALLTRTFTVHDGQGNTRLMRPDQMDPGWRAFPHKARRMFDDWAASSAGRSGARLCHHWVAKISDDTDNTGTRWMSYIPRWTTSLKLARIDAAKGSAQDLLARLEKLDQRMGVPFAWYFYMLHGNRVKDEAGYQVLKAAEEGLIALPEHDYQVLRRWRDRVYGF